MILLAALLVWFTLAALTASIALGYFQKAWPTIAKETYRTDLGAAWVFGLVAPISLVLVVLLSGFVQHGLMNPFVLNKYKE